MEGRGVVLSHSVCMCVLVCVCNARLNAASLRPITARVMSYVCLCVCLCVCVCVRERVYLQPCDPSLRTKNEVTAKLWMQWKEGRKEKE